MDRESRNGAFWSRVVKKKRKKEWTPMFPVPSHLVESYGGVLPSKVTFRTNESEKKWKLKIEKFNDRYFFTNGWEGFEKEVDVKSRELIMRRADGSSKRNGKNIEKRRKISGTGNARGTMNLSFSLSFCKELKKYNQYGVEIPTIFAESTGIHKRYEIKLRNSEGREWPVHVTKRLCKNRYSVTSLCGGWYNFLKDNNMVVGSTLSFLSSTSDTIDVQVVKEGTDKEALFAYLKTRGRGNSNNASDRTKAPTSSVLNVESENEEHSSSSEEEMDSP